MFIRKFSFIALLSLSFSSCFLEHDIDPSSQVSTVEHNFSRFDGIRVGGDFHVIVESGTDYKVEVTANENLHNHINLKVSDERLTISLDRLISISGNKTLEVRISLPDLEHASISGNARFDLVNTLTEDDLDIDASGNSRFNGAVELNELDIDASGNVRINISGTARDVSYDFSGNVEAGDYSLIAEDVDADFSGNAKAWLTIEKEIDYNGSGNATLFYKGSPAQIRQNTSGNAKLIRE